jgi:aspartate/methionine/tyrosine aminotransferase
MPIEIESPESLGYGNIACNLAESSVKDASFKQLKINLDELVLAYGDHMGKPELRQLVANAYSGISSDQVLLTVGAAGALFMIHTTLLTDQDHIVVVRPNYGTNIETPRAIGTSISFIDLTFEAGYALDLKKLKSSIQPNTKLISVTTPHNPTGTSLSELSIMELCRMAEEHNCFLLVDETYRDLSFAPSPPLAASLSNRAISVSSVSKAYGIPGIRLGWIICQDADLMNRLLAAKEQIHICNSIVDEEIGYQYLLRKDDYFPAIRQMLNNNFQELDQWMSHHHALEWIRPTGGVVCFPRFKQDLKIDPEVFYSVLMKEFKTYLGPGHWFEQDKSSFRLGFGWEEEPVFKQGLANIDLAIKAAINGKSD